MLDMGMWHHQIVFKRRGQRSMTDDVDNFLDLYPKPYLLTTLDLVYTPYFQKSKSSQPRDSVLPSHLLLSPKVSGPTSSHFPKKVAWPLSSLTGYCQYFKSCWCYGCSPLHQISHSRPHTPSLCETGNTGPPAPLANWRPPTLPVPTLWSTFFKAWLLISPPFSLDQVPHVHKVTLISLFHN